MQQQQSSPQKIREEQREKTENHFIFVIIKNPLQSDYKVQKRLEGMCSGGRAEEMQKKKIVFVWENNNMVKSTDRTGHKWDKKRGGKIKKWTDREREREICFWLRLAVQCTTYSV